MGANGGAPLVLVTGATDGIGLETARQCAERGARVIIHGRDEDKLERVHHALHGVGGVAHPAPVRADFSSLAEVRRVAEELVDRGLCPNVLVNNAGLYATRERRSADGFELTMAVNHLAPFLLTHALLRSRRDRLRRVVNVSSIAHGRGRIDLADPWLLRRPFDAYGAYAASKLGNVLFTVELARRYPRLRVNALHPGVVSTKLLREGFGIEGSPPADGATTSVMLALDPIGGEVSGRYFAADREAPMNPAAHDPRLTTAFYEASARAVGLEP